MFDSVFRWEDILGGMKGVRHPMLVFNTPQQNLAEIIKNGFSVLRLPLVCVVQTMAINRK